MLNKRQLSAQCCAQCAQLRTLKLAQILKKIGQLRRCILHILLWMCCTKAPLLGLNIIYGIIKSTEFPAAVHIWNANSVSSNPDNVVQVVIKLGILKEGRRDGVCNLFFFFMHSLFAAPIIRIKKSVSKLTESLCHKLELQFKRFERLETRVCNMVCMSFAHLILNWIIQNLHECATEN